MKRQLFPALVLWIALTVVLEIVAVKVDIYVVPKSDKGEEIDFAFRYLMYLAIPVFAMVIAVLLTSAVGGSAKFPEEDGPAQFGRGAAPMTWFVLTALLAVAVMIYPGLITTPKVAGKAKDPDVRVKVEGVQWTWLINYPDAQVEGAREIVLPVDATVRFDITSRDVLHSFWIPSFLMKIDAVPGLTTTVSLKPTEEGSYQNDQNMRVQCAELCGLSHSRMTVPVRVVSREAYDEWVRSKQTGPAANQTPTGPVTELTIIAKNITFDTKTLTVPAGSSVKLTMDNQDPSIPHNFALYASEDAATKGEDPIAASKLETGPVKQTLVFNAPAAGTYFFRCDVHPAAMTGTFVVQ
ncbi:MAG: cytochrome c oxidase subunit II [Chloroflexi bacterium]|nr:cytochrome c oxidase subunit II [Chloroflexota bacterium]